MKYRSLHIAQSTSESIVQIQSKLLAIRVLKFNNDLCKYSYNTSRQAISDYNIIVTRIEGRRPKGKVTIHPDYRNTINSYLSFVKSFIEEKLLGSIYNSILRTTTKKELNIIIFYISLVVNICNNGDKTTINIG